MTTHQPRGMSRTVTLCLQFPIVTTTLWRQLAGKTMTVLHPQYVIILHCHVCLGLSNPFISSALWRQFKSKNTTHLPGHGYPRPTLGLGWSSGYKWLVQYLYPIMHFALKFSSQPPPKLYWPQKYKHKLSQCMRFPTIRYVRPAKPQISLCIRTVCSEPLIVAWVFYDC